jgi:hypothetical protein
MAEEMRGATVMARAAKPRATTKSPETTFITSTFDFFSTVLKSIAHDDVLRVLWGVEVLLFSILLAVLIFRVLTGDQVFTLALVVIGTVVGTFLITVWRTRAQPAAPSIAATTRAAPQAQDPAALQALIDQGRQCLGLMVEIHDANKKVIQRGRGGVPAWSRMQTQTYNPVCQACQQRRLGATPDPYLDVLCGEPDLMTVCNKKWELGQALDDYRNAMRTVSPPPLKHEALELLVRRSVTDPDCAPNELDVALSAAIERARAVLS